LEIRHIGWKCKMAKWDFAGKMIRSRYSGEKISRMKEIRAAKILRNSRTTIYNTKINK